MTASSDTPILPPTPASWGEPRSKTVSWHDPVTTATAGLNLTGREYLQQVVDGLLPPAPISRLFGFSFGEIGDGEVRFACTPDESSYNPIGLVHGGLVCTLLDSVIGCAVHTTLPAGVGYSSIEISISYLRPVTRDTGEITAVGRVTKPGRRVAFGEGQVLDASGKLLATATGSCLIMGG